MKELEKDMKKMKKVMAEEMVKELQDTAPVVTWNLKGNFYYVLKKNYIEVKDKMKYWFYVEFWPHSKPSLGFSRRALNKVMTEETFNRLKKKVWK